MKEIYSEIQIKGSPALIWKVFTECEKYPEWNPFIKSLDGNIKKGKFIEVFIQPPDMKGMTFKSKIISYDEYKELSWKGSFIIPGLFDGTHTFKLESVDDEHTNFIQKEEFKGLFLPFFKRDMHEKTEKGFELMNEALKKLVEEQGTQ